MPNSRSLAGLEVAEKFMVVWGGVGGGFQVATMSNLNEVVFELLLVELGFGNYELFFDSE